MEEAMPTRTKKRPSAGATLDLYLPLSVLTVSTSDLEDRLGKTVLWRSDIDRTHVADPEQALATAQRVRPSLVVVDAGGVPDAIKLIHKLRRDPATRYTSIVAIAGRARNLRDEQLREAGANLVLPSTLRAAIYDRRLEELLEVPPRRETRLSAHFQLWCRSEPSGPLREALVLNISVRGMLIETEEPLPAGATVEIRLPLPNEPEPVPLMALVERVAQEAEGRHRSGIQFLILRDHVRDRIRAYIDSAAV
jgi:CheY-like chemotaxis protein